MYLFQQDLYASVKSDQIMQAHVNNNESKLAESEEAGETESNATRRILRRKRALSIRSGSLPCLTKQDTHTDLSRSIERRSSNASTLHDTTFISSDLRHEASMPTLSASCYGCSSETTTIQKQKQGIVMRKHVLECTEQKAKYRGWQASYMTVEEGLVKLYRAPRDLLKRKSLGSAKLDSMQTDQTTTVSIFVLIFVVKDVFTERDI